MRLIVSLLMMLFIVCQSIDAGGLKDQIFSALGKQDEKQALALANNPELTDLIKRHFNILKNFDKCHDKLTALFLSKDLDSIHQQIRSQLSK